MSATKEINGVHSTKELAPPTTKWPYRPTDALDDIPGVAYALDTFLKSKMVESEDYCHSSDPTKERLYFATGFGLIQCVKALMSYEDEDLLAALGHTKHGNTIAMQHRKKAASLPWRLAGYVTGSTGVGWIQSMTPVERHAELVYAESLFEKALLGIVYSGDWLAFIKEALNMRTTIQVYRQLGKYIDALDAEAHKRGDPEDASIDVHFRSGVYLGVGMSNLILSLMPARLLTIVELFGYKGDRKLGLELLQRAGGWSNERPEPSVSQEDEGVRRSICDMALLIFHLVLSSVTSEGVDITMAQKILDWNLQRYPQGVFFLFGEGRVSMCRSQPKKAIECYLRANAAQTQYRNLHHVSFWEMAIANLSLWELPESLKCWRSLHEESTWSKAIYAYGTAAVLLQLGGDENQKEAMKLMAKVPELRQRIAGKSIPLEKFVARKARKAQAQHGRLCLPALELAAIYGGVAHAPREAILSRMIPLIESTLAELKTHEATPASYNGGQGYWDDLCLARYLEGLCMRFVAYPDPDALFDPEEELAISQADAAARALAAFESVFANGPRIELDHYLVYISHFEYGRLLAYEGEKARAREQFELVYSGKPLEVNAAGRKGKYSMESGLHLRTHAALEALDHNRQV
ncbi:hypothetical protein OF83DRAFT_1110594 [Amylostereum chailletii]|nr:hypothetical protein OF83DRAFT_1110594 [Amylostereum chailletii]